MNGNDWLILIGAILAACLFMQLMITIEAREIKSLRQLVYWLIRDIFTSADSLLRSAWGWIVGPGPEKRKRGE